MAEEAVVGVNVASYLLSSKKLQKYFQAFLGTGTGTVKALAVSLWAKEKGNCLDLKSSAVEQHYGHQRTGAIGLKRCPKRASRHKPGRSRKAGTTPPTREARQRP